MILTRILACAIKKQDTICNKTRPFFPQMYMHIAQNMTVAFTVDRSAFPHCDEVKLSVVGWFRLTDNSFYVKAFQA